jgi:hypothetical protein
VSCSFVRVRMAVTYCCFASEHVHLLSCVLVFCLHLSVLCSHTSLRLAWLGGDSHACAAQYHALHTYGSVSCQVYLRNWTMCVPKLFSFVVLVFWCIIPWCPWSVLCIPCLHTCRAGIPCLESLHCLPGPGPVVCVLISVSVPSGSLSLQMV